MPPPSLDNAAPAPTSLGSRYLSWGQLDLPFTLARSGAARKDIQDQLCTVDNRAFQLFFELPKLCRQQLVVNNHHVDVGLGARRGERQHLAAADECRGVWSGPFLQHPQDHERIGRVREPREFVKGTIGLDAPCRAGDQANEGGTFMLWRRR